MKPTRHLAMPKAPRFVHLDKVSGRLQIPQLRLERLLKTSRFQSFAREKDDAGDWLWLSPDFDEKESLGVESFRQEVIEPLPLGEKARRQFENDFALAKEEGTGAKAFEFFEVYHEKRIDDEPVAPRFLELAVEKNYDRALKWRTASDANVLAEESVCFTATVHDEKLRDWLLKSPEVDIAVIALTQREGCYLRIPGYPIPKDSQIRIPPHVLSSIPNSRQVFSQGRKYRAVIVENDSLGRFTFEIQQKRAK